MVVVSVAKMSILMGVKVKMLERPRVPINLEGGSLCFSDLVLGAGDWTLI